MIAKVSHPLTCVYINHPPPPFPFIIRPVHPEVAPLEQVIQEDGSELSLAREGEGEEEEEEDSEEEGPVFLDLTGLKHSRQLEVCVCVCVLRF